VLSTSPQACRASTEVASGTRELVIRQGSVVDDRGGRRRLLETGIELEETNVNRVTITEDAPLSARVRCDWTVSVGRRDWQVEVRTRSVMTSDADRFLLTNALEAYQGERRVFAKTWTKSVPRDLV
jgi:uncharacterized protein